MIGPTPLEFARIQKLNRRNKLTKEERDFLVSMSSKLMDHIGSLHRRMFQLIFENTRLKAKHKYSQKL